MPLQVRVSDGWPAQFPGAHVGLLAVDGLSGAAAVAAFEQELGDVEAELRQRYAGTDRVSLAALPVMRTYQRHYRAFGQTYHVVRQLESVALKGRPIGSPGGALVSAMFAAELDSLLLTAGHDTDRLVGPLVIDCSRVGDRFVGIGGQELVLKPGDMLMRDTQGIISAVLSGPDQRTRLSAETRRALFVTYAPVGIPTDALQRHLERLGRLVRLAEPAAQVGAPCLYPTRNALT
jgi:DNA/RNA-binding domain of Phe-tRNA-synthetase-like protein